ncbi:hypothetical protein KKD81_02765 [Patescibacteria group bacterium]|nr:hypothetical protein [Patescibacteria group bacterium]MBU2158890.1 hypothetical protein [Patescibacteria group bacterium]MBU2220833.1 hypothetical protein [Patescibacteria group bacterium]
MTRNTLLQLGASLIFLVLAIAFLNPFGLWMTDMFHMLILGLLVVAFGIFATLVVREQGGDERELVHRMIAGRAAFLTGALILLIGIIWQAFTHTLDYWLVYALLGMVLAKTLVRIYGDRRL